MARILVIDDDEQIRSLLRSMLEHAGHEVVTAHDGNEGIALYRSQEADLIITDIIMPVREGISTIHELRRDFPEVKIIAITGGGRHAPLGHYLDMAGKIGAVRAIPKPFNRQQMLDAVSELAGRTLN